MPALVHVLDDTDRAALQQHFCALPPADLRMRFGRVPGEDWLRSYVDGLDFSRDTVLGVRDATPRAARLLGVTHVASYQGAVELGLSVLPEARRQGIASAMFDRAALHARNRGVVELFMHCLAENRAMRTIASRAGMRVVMEDGEVDAWIELPVATPFSLGREFITRQQAIVDQAMPAALPRALPARHDEAARDEAIVA